MWMGRLRSSERRHTAILNEFFAENRRTDSFKLPQPARLRLVLRCSCSTRRENKGFSVSVWGYGIVGAGKAKERLEDVAAVWLQSECFFVDSRYGLDTDCCDRSLDALNSALVAWHRVQKLKKQVEHIASVSSGASLMTAALHLRGV
jgi:hypothetical protein